MAAFLDDKQCAGQLLQNRCNARQLAAIGLTVSAQVEARLQIFFRSATKNLCNCSISTTPLARQGGQCGRRSFDCECSRAAKGGNHEPWIARSAMSQARIMDKPLIGR
jgi:hypothetical protein